MPKKPLWQIPKLWPGGECFIIGGGPSIRSLDINRLRGHRTIAVNVAFRIAPWADVMYFGDCRLFDKIGVELLSFAGLKITTCERHVDKPGIQVVKKRNNPMGLAPDSSVLGWNLSSGAAAINIAAHMGVRRIVLLGFDMRRVDGRCNFHDDYPAHPNKNPYKRFMVPFAAIARDLERLHIECVNAAPGSALDVFPIVDPDTVLPQAVNVPSVGVA